MWEWRMTLKSNADVIAASIALCHKLRRYDRLLLKGKHTKGRDKSTLLKNEFKKVFHLFAVFCVCFRLRSKLSYECCLHDFLLCCTFELI